LQRLRDTENPADLTQADRDVLGIKDKLPASLAQALRYFDEDEQLKKALGDSLVRKFMVMKDGELKRMNTMPEEDRWRWEVERY
jgi:glutamine synthetase